MGLTATEDYQLGAVGGAAGGCELTEAEGFTATYNNQLGAMGGAARGFALGRVEK